MFFMAFAPKFFETISVVFPAVTAGKIISILICVSTAGAVNGLIFTGGRISYALGADHGMFRLLGKWNPRSGVPASALLAQGAISLAIIFLAGSFIEAILYATPVVWLFFLGTALSLFVLRRKDPRTERAYRVPAYPIIPLAFCASCLFMLYNSVSYAWNVRPRALLILCSVLLCGIPLYAISRRFENRHVAETRGEDA